MIRTAAARVPICFRRLGELAMVHAPGNRIGDIEGLRGLPSLTSLVLFRQGEVEPTDPRCHGEGCRPSYETAAGVGDEGLYLCPEGSLALQLHELPSFGWPRLEKLWLDGLYLQARP